MIVFGITSGFTLVCTFSEQVASTIFCKSSEIRPPNCFEARRGGGVLLEYLTSLVHTPPRFPTTLRSRSTITTTAAIFWMNGRFAECVLQEISGACLDTKPRGIEAIYLHRQW